MKLQIVQKNLLLLGLSAGLIAGCNSGTTAATPQSVSVPLLVSESAGQIKYYAYTSAGGGVPGKTIIDTGSDVYYITRDAVGPNVQYTTESIILYYDFGNRQVPGILAYAPVTIYDGNTGVLTSSPNTPIVVVESAAAPFIGLMGVSMQAKISANLFFPYPYNQGVSINLPESTVSFGVFNQTINSNGASSVQLQQQVCNNYGIPLESDSATCWNTFGLQVQTAFLSSESIISPPLMEGVLDTGSDSGFQLDPMPDYVTISDGYTTNFAYAYIQTSTGPLQMFMTPKVYAATNATHGGNFVNLGNNVFNYYQIIFNRYDGKVWFKSPVQ